MNMGPFELGYCHTCHKFFQLDEAALARLENLTRCAGERITRLEALDILHHCCDSPLHYWVLPSEIMNISGVVPMAGNIEQWRKWAAENKEKLSKVIEILCEASNESDEKAD